MTCCCSDSVHTTTVDLLHRPKASKPSSSPLQSATQANPPRRHCPIKSPAEFPDFVAAMPSAPRSASVLFTKVCPAATIHSP
ncbi:hypothetical protein M0R45_006844 [Rubus argutus]|uniref:Uncharacterized protein n=1 Tax=Rubus argutus TaxID=59490 RepID=A0AAW1YS04_RUBAR